MQDYVLTGQASVEIYFTSLYGPISVRGHQTVLAAGEQGASWEMLENLLRVAQSQGIGMLTPEAINVVAYELGLDVDALNAVIDSGRYDDTLASYKNLFDELGLQGVPSVAVYVDGEWQVQQDWSYEALAELVAQ
jgi:predicted DsbA family dithiol-disulfide isomerase